ncbi:MAG TPA: NAD-dependent epimerase/dehydratase family protein [Clostridia bacterium]|nr:NAD-dependent epimerase/dehydratase family protein [Clostridia bacterium]
MSDKLNDLSILVTGGAGFIGSHLCERLLCLGNRVVCLDNFNDAYDHNIKINNIQAALSDPGFRLIEGDILDSALVGDIMERFGIDTVVHLAALAGVRASIAAPLDYVDTDIKGTVTLLEASRKHGIKKFIFASSSSVYGTSATPFSEADTALSQVSPYAAAKYSGELYCRTFHELYGIPTVCLRFFTVYGPRQRPDMAISKFTRAIAEDREINIYGNGSSSRDYTYVDDIIDGIIASIRLKCGFEVINLGNSSTAGILDLVKIIESRLGKTAKTRFIPDQLGDVPATFADIGKASALLGFKPKVGLAEGIGRFADWLGQKEN